MIIASILLSFAISCAAQAAPLTADDVIFGPETQSSAVAPVAVHSSIELIPAVMLDESVRSDGRAMALITAASATVAEVVRKFMAGLVPDANGIDQLVPDENPIDQFVSQIAKTKFQWLIQGVGNLKMLNDPYLYNEIQGGVGVEYDLIGQSDNIFENQPDTIVALRFTPLYGEIAYLRLASGSLDMDGLPSRALFGSSFGIELMHRFGIFEPGVRAYARPLVELNGAHDVGVSIESAVYCRIKVADMHWLDPIRKTDLYVTPYVSYYDRSAAISDLDEVQEPGLYRGVGALRRQFIGGFNLEIRR